MDFAEDSTQTPPPELSLAFSCERWHALPYEGGLLDQPAGLMHRMSLVMNIHNAFKSRLGYRDESGSENWAEWANKFPEAARLLEAAEQERHG